MTVHPKQYERMRDTLNSRCNHARPISSYGGNPANMNGTHSTGFFSTFSRSSQKYYEPNIVDKVEVVRVNDYTKNISSSIFTPSLRTVVNQQQNQNHYHKRPNNDRNHQAVVGDRQFKSPQPKNQNELRKSHNQLSAVKVSHHLNGTKNGGKTDKNIQKLEFQLTQEKFRRENLQRQVKDLKDQMSTFYSLSQSKK